MARCIEPTVKLFSHCYYYSSSIVWFALVKNVVGVVSYFSLVEFMAPLRQRVTGIEREGVSRRRSRMEQTPG